MNAAVLSADRQKFHRTPIWLLVVLGPILVIILQTANYLLRYDYLTSTAKDVWTKLTVDVHFLAMLLLPMGTAVLASLMAGMEHQANAWKQLFALPRSRASIYLSKHVWLLLMLLVSGILLGAGLLILGLALGFGPRIPWSLIVGEAFLPVLAILPVLGLQLWLSTVVSNQAVPISIGIGGAVFGLLLAQSKITALLPWAYPVLSAPVADPMINPARYVPLALVVGAVIITLGTIHVTRRDIS